MMFLKKRIDDSRIVMLGVLPEYLNPGIGGVLFYEIGPPDHGTPGSRAAKQAGCSKTMS